jgi:hypothetical protein
MTSEMGKPIGELRTLATKRARADSETVTEFLSRTGYQLPVAIADLIDNAIDAKASRVHVGLIFSKERPASLIVADNGCGMAEDELERAVSLQKDPRKQSGKALGRYGAGLKAASFSLGRVLTIATRCSGGTPIGAQLDQSRYRKRYEYGVLDPRIAGLLLSLDWGGDKLGGSGTVLMISDLTAMVPTSNTSQDLFLESFEKELDVRLGLVYHRFLDSGRVKITKGKRDRDDPQPEFGMQSVAAVNPFGYPVTGRKGYPKRFSIPVSGLSVPVVLHLWPKQGRTKDSRDPNYDILGRSGEWQGFYYYRWDRMLQAGGWNGVLSQEPHTSYARISVDLPLGSDSHFRPTVMKDRIENPRPLLEVLTNKREWADYISDARTVYRASATRKNPAFGREGTARPSDAKLAGLPGGALVRLNEGGNAELSSKIPAIMGAAKADALVELVSQAARPFGGRSRLSNAMKDDWRRLAHAVKVLVDPDL